MAIFMYSEENEIPTVERLDDHVVDRMEARTFPGDTLNHLATSHPEVIYFEVEPEDGEHVFLIAFQVSAPTRAEGERRLCMMLPSAVTEWRKPGAESLEAWWVAEDDRHDGSDCDSAVFVHPGKQAEASRFLAAVGLTGENNIVGEGSKPSHSAEHGEAWLVRVTYNTEADGVFVDDASSRPHTLHGPFATQDAARLWMDTYPDDTDVSDIDVVPLNLTQEA